MYLSAPLLLSPTMIVACRIPQPHCFCTDDKTVKDSIVAASLDA